MQQTGFANAAQMQGVRAGAQAPAAMAGAGPMAKSPGGGGGHGAGNAGGGQPQGTLRMAPAAPTNSPEMAHGAGTATMPGATQHQGAGGGLHLMRPEAAAAGAAAPAASKRATPAARQAPRAEPAGRAQPRAQALPTPVPGSRKKSAVYTALFVIVALGVGAVVARLAMSFF
jgi:hypothetical protein